MGCCTLGLGLALCARSPGGERTLLQRVFSLALHARVPAQRAEEEERGNTLNPRRGETVATGACSCRCARSNCAGHHALASCRGGWGGWEEVLADEGNVSTYGSDLESAEAWLSDVRLCNAQCNCCSETPRAPGRWSLVPSYMPRGQQVAARAHALHHAAPSLQQGTSPLACRITCIPASLRSPAARLDHP